MPPTITPTTTGAASIPGTSAAATSTTANPTPITGAAPPRTGDAPARDGVTRKELADVADATRCGVLQGSFGGNRSGAQAREAQRSRGGRSAAGAPLAAA